MSHFVTINTQIRDVAALRDACGELGLQVHDNTTARGYSTAHTPGEHVIRLLVLPSIATDILVTGNLPALELLAEHRVDSI
ncbi:MAG: hypothetical protein ACI8XO_000276 [Verrucomicrobiales bacterium]|jgi:hypothetical protein